MIRLKKVTAVLLSALLVSSCMAPCTFAASKTKVGKINLTIDTDIRSGSSGGEVEVTPTGDNTEYFYIDSVEVTNDEGDDWSKSNPPEAEIRIGLEDEDEYTFSGSSSSNFKLTLASSIKSRYDKVEYVSARKTDGGATIILNIRLVFDKDADMSNAAAPGSVEWSASSEGTATWGDVSSDNAKSKWVSSSSWTPGSNTSDNNNTNTFPEGWQKAADGIRWWWQNPDGSYPASQWKETDGKWYYFDAEGYMATGWINVGGVDYCLAPDGALYVSCTTPDGYNVDANGAWIH